MTLHLSGNYGIDRATESTVALSIVSHGQGNLIRSLLEDLLRLNGGCSELILTLNVPEDESYYIPYMSKLPLRVVKNSDPRGFGENHNAAFALSKADVFVIVNPDIRCRSFNIAALTQLLETNNVGAVAPLVLSSDGKIQDSFRQYPTLLRVARRTLFRKRMPEYELPKEPIAVDWVAGMFVAYKRAAFESVGGFDERYFLYFEDADIGRRLLRHGWLTMIQPAWYVTHDAQRSSHRELKYMWWHLRSLVRFLCS